MQLLTGIPAHELPPKFRDNSSQYVSSREGSRVTLAAELYEITKDTEIECGNKREFPLTCLQRIFQLFDRRRIASTRVRFNKQN
ncbi:hypothetical protein WA026_018458 [Henosepilachna vigintioctopunctata]|uniref:Uncharacterized protein n=1 Tax=Henosepilachna vigintioctopunctata TaxID=420089 RepID=A0AAW1V3N3_9CUCU